MTTTHFAHITDVSSRRVTVRWKEEVVNGRLVLYCCTGADKRYSRERCYRPIGDGAHCCPLNGLCKPASWCTCEKTATVGLCEDDDRLAKARHGLPEGGGTAGHVPGELLQAGLHACSTRRAAAQREPQVGPILALHLVVQHVVSEALMLPAIPWRTACFMPPCRRLCIVMRSVPTCCPSRM
mmetsp:Transcript_11819/g.40314  ORF Transcript_11819/g.40314 Transcript_11819/m.40314 type:complete len:182 (-) Transcript_11819:208-753(-)